MRLLVGRDTRLRSTLLNAVFALVFAVLIWAAVGARLTAPVTFRVPFELRVPHDVAVEYRDPYAPPGSRPLVEVVLRGPHESLARLNPSEIQGYRELASLDEKAIDEGQEQTVEVAASSFHVATKESELRVESVVPDRVKFVLSRIGKREFRVKEDVVGEPAPGYRRTTVLLDPDVIDISGPRGLLAKLAGPVRTEPVDVTGRNETFTSYRKVHSPAEGLVPEDRVRVTVVIEPEPIEKVFELPVRIVTTPETMKPHYVFDPPEQDWKAKIPLRGPADALAALEARLKRSLDLSSGEPLAFVR
ncbi:YbbR-like domain-containing protein, partial [bacterium]|nr:YbbR-like domain-containing protein [bacterium]